MSLKELYHKYQKYHRANAMRQSYHALYKRIFSLHPELAAKEKNENLWLEKWRHYDKHVSVSSYRIFSKFIGEDINIIPLEICATQVEPVLTPYDYLEFYSDKNSLNLSLPHDCMPAVLMRNIGGKYMDEDYNPLDINDFLAQTETTPLILKPSRECSGRGVQVIDRKQGNYYTRTGELVSSIYLQQHYHKDFLMQKCVRQHPFLEQFNPTSVNTIRIFTYRDIQGIVHPMRSILRIGGKGANVDNAHSGGMFCGVSDDGTLGKYCCSFLADRTPVFNGIDFEHGKYVIPEFDKIKSFSAAVGRRIPFHDLIAMDIALDCDSEPKLLEINTGGFSAWLFQFTVGPCFGTFTDEIMERCTHL